MGVECRYPVPVLVLSSFSLFDHNASQAQYILRRCQKATRSKAKSHCRTATCFSSCGKIVKVVIHNQVQVSGIILLASDQDSNWYNNITADILSIGVPQIQDSCNHFIKMKARLLESIRTQRQTVILSRQWKGMKIIHYDQFKESRNEGKIEQIGWFLWNGKQLYATTYLDLNNLSVFCFSNQLFDFSPGITFKFFSPATKSS